MASLQGGLENSISSLTTRPPGLRVLGSDSKDCDVDVVLVPGAGIPAVEEWPFASSKWLAQYLSSKEHDAVARVLTFEYTFDLDDRFTWGCLWEQGDRLLRALARSRRNDGAETDTRPILFVCHSLGGLVLKQALCIAKEQLHRYETLINVVSGIIFQGTPHFRSNQADKGTAILQATTRSRVKIPNNAVDESLILSDLSARFEATRIRCPILSVYETKETKVPQGRFKNKRMILVDKDTCTIHAPREQFLPVPLDHIEICQFDTADKSTEAQAAIGDFVKSVLQNAKADILGRMEAMEYRYAATTNYSPTISDSSFVEVIDDAQRRDNRQNTPLNTTAATHGSIPKSGSSQGYEATPSGAGFERTESHGRVPQLPCRLLEAESRNPSFVGQEEILKEISWALLPPETEFISTISEPLRRFALCGMGGIGKTELAIEFAFRNTDAFDAIFFVSADETSKLDAQFSEIAVRLGLETAPESTNHVISRELVKGWLSNPWKPHTSDGNGPVSVEQATWLLIFDNADDPYILADYWPIQGAGSVLITSRDPLAKSIFSTIPSGIDMEPLTEEEGGTLLRKITNDKDEEGLSGQIFSLLGGLPLAITQMAGVIRRQELRLSEFMEIYKDQSEHSSLYQLHFPQGQHKIYPHTISTVWALQSVKPVTERLLHILAFMDPDCIQESILTGTAARKVEGENANPESLLLNALDFRSARTELLQASLIKRNKATEELRIHRLVQDMVRAKMTPATLKETFWGMVNLLWSHWPTAFSPPTKKGPAPTENLHLISRWPTCAALYPHVLRLKVIYADQQVQGKDNTLGQANLQFASLLADAAWYQFERGRSRGFDGFWDIALPACEAAAPSPVRTSILVDIDFAMGAIAMETNDHAASYFHKERALRLQVQTVDELDVLDLRLSRCYSEMSIALIQDGKYDDAIDHIMRSIEIDKALGVYPRHWHAEANLGLAYTLMGDLPKADEVLSGTLARREEMFGYMDNKDYRLGRVLHAFGNLREAQGREEDSFNLHTRALTSFEATVGKNHHRVADLSHKVAQHLLRAGKYTEALEKCDRALQIWTFDESVYKPEIARTTFLKGVVFRALGNEVKARLMEKKAAAMRRQILLSMPTRGRTGSSGIGVNVDDGSGYERGLSGMDFDALVNFWSK